MGYPVILVIIDWFSKYNHFLLLAHPFITTTVARAFMDQVARLHGVPQSIVSDRNPMFTNQF